jgi:pilus assembly protein Flp/PilA
MTFKRMLQDESGASAAEYALILAIIGGAVAVASIALGASVGEAMNRTSNCIHGKTSAACS